MTAAELAARVEREGVRLRVRGDSVLQATTHYGISRADVDRAVEAIRRALREPGIQRSRTDQGRREGPRP
jgi:hypothetical protein